MGERPCPLSMSRCVENCPLWLGGECSIKVIALKMAIPEPMILCKPDQLEVAKKIMASDIPKKKVVKEVKTRKKKGGK